MIPYIRVPDLGPNDFTTAWDWALFAISTQREPYHSHKLYTDLDREGQLFFEYLVARRIVLRAELFLDAAALLSLEEDFGKDGKRVFGPYGIFSEDQRIILREGSENYLDSKTLVSFEDDGFFDKESWYKAYRAYVRIFLEDN